MKARRDFAPDAQGEAEYQEYMLDCFAKAAMNGELAAQGNDYLWNDSDTLADRSYSVAQAMWRAKQTRNRP